MLCTIISTKRIDKKSNTPVKTIFFTKWKDGTISFEPILNI